MRARRKWTIWGLVTAVALTVLFAAVWVFWGPFSFESAEAKVKEEAVLLNGRDPERMQPEANRFYWGHNLALATSLCRWAEILFTQRRGPRADLRPPVVGLLLSQLSFPQNTA
jgi:hypothetical protein